MHSFDIRSRDRTEESKDSSGSGQLFPLASMISERGRIQPLYRVNTPAKRRILLHAAAMFGFVCFSEKRKKERNKI